MPVALDQPGTCEAIRLQRLPSRFDTEAYGTPFCDDAAAHPEIDAARVGISGISLGGYYVPRIAAHESRFKSGSVWGANHNWAEVQQKRMKREGENPLPHYWNHVHWVFGAQDQQEFLEMTKGMDLTGQMEKIKMPFLVTHGEGDRQIGVEYAYQSFEQLTNSARPELKIFTPQGWRHRALRRRQHGLGGHYHAAWFAETLRG